MTQANARETSLDTKDRILNATEVLIASQGIHATSLRQITAAASVNLAAVNYHFQSKDDLVLAVYRRRIIPMNEERLALLGELEATYKTCPPPLSDVLNAFFEPVVNLAIGMDREGIPLGAMLGRIYTEPSEKFNSDFMREMGNTMDRFVAVLHRILPQLDQPTLLWRMWFTIGIVAHTLGAGAKLEQRSQGLCKLGNRAETLRQMIAYAKAGLEAAAA